MSIAMDRARMLEEKLRESACVGDVESLQVLLHKGVNVNARHAINGWTPLHWAVKRGHRDAVGLLLANGADVNVRTKENYSVLSLCTSSDIRQLVKPQMNGDLKLEMTSESRLPITPHYLKHPPLADHIDLHEIQQTGGHEKVLPVGSEPSFSQELVFKVRIANSEDQDFIEVELPLESLSYSHLLQLCAEELGISPSFVTRIRKLPNTILRKDKDVARLKDGQELELVLKNDGVSNFIPSGNGLLKRSSGGSLNGYQPISMNKNQTILY